MGMRLRCISQVHLKRYSGTKTGYQLTVHFHIQHATVHRIPVVSQLPLLSLDNVILYRKGSDVEILSVYETEHYL